MTRRPTKEDPPSTALGGSVRRWGSPLLLRQGTVAAADSNYSWGAGSTTDTSLSSKGTYTGVSEAPPPSESELA